MKKKRGFMIAIDKDEQEIQATGKSKKIILQLLATRFVSGGCPQTQSLSVRSCLMTWVEQAAFFLSAQMSAFIRDCVISWH